MKKVLLLLLCLSLGFSLIACGLIQNQTSPVLEEKEEPIVVSLGSETVEVVQADPPLNAPTLNYGGFSIYGYYLGYIEMGSYPQTLAHHKAVAEMSLATDATGYYYSTWDNCHYAKVSKAKIYGKRFKFSDDTFITENEVYYFKVEPVRWWVFIDSESAVSAGSTITLISEGILDSYAFCLDENRSQDIFTQSYYRTDYPDVLANSWGYSDLRTWLNTEFLTRVFSVAEERLLVSRNTSSVTGIYNQEDPTEKIWVPSANEILAYQKVISAFNIQTLKSYATTTAVVSDFARCRSTFMSIYPEFYGCGRYWTTTAGSESYQVAYVPCDNHDYDIENTKLYGETVSMDCIGVRPVIRMYANDVTGKLQEPEEE